MKKHFTKSQKLNRLKTFSFENKRKATTSEEKFQFILYQVRKYLRISQDIDIGQIRSQEIMASNSASTGYLLDFFLPRLMLAFEIDGPSHNNKTAYDHKRDAFCDAKGIKTIRYKNEEVFANGFGDRLREEIIQIVNERFPKGNADLHFRPIPIGAVRESRYLSYMKERHLRR